MIQKLTLLLISLSFFSVSLYSQQALQREALLIMAAEKSQSYTVQKKEAFRLADSLGIPKRQVLENNVVIELQRFEQGIPVYYITHNSEGAHTISSSLLYPGGTAGLELSGKGETLGVWDAGAVLASHQEFKGRVTQKDDASSESNHATHVAGTMMAAGVDGASKGMAYEANLHAYDWNDDDAQMAQAAADGLRVSQHSYGAITGWNYNYRNDERWAWFGNTSISEEEDYRFGFYNERARGWDQIAHMAPYYLIVKSAGNDRNQGPGTQPAEHWVSQNGDWVLSTSIRQADGGADGFDCLSTNSTAKNILTVGAVHGLPTGYSHPFMLKMASFSSWGPTDDGRIKPDLVAKGVGVKSSSSSNNEAYSTLSGTSMAGPMVSGSIGLLLQHQRNLHGGNPMLSSSMKALLIHSADEAGQHDGPDYMFGWGLMNTAKAAAIMSENANYGGSLHVQEHVLVQDQEIIIPVIASGNEPLRVTIGWTDVPGTPGSPALNSPARMLVNNLDLRLNQGDDNEFMPYVLDPANPVLAATPGDNNLDNVEMVLVNEPMAGKIYLIKINHKESLQGGEQSFSLIVTGNSDSHNPVFFSAEPMSDSLINLTWLPNADNDPVMLVASQSNVNGIPQDGTSYSVGESLPGGGTVLYMGEENGFEHHGLSPDTYYYYKAFSIAPDMKYSLGRSARAATFCGLVSQFPFVETFETEAELPSCWKVTDSIGNQQVWKTGTIPFGLPEAQGNYALINSQGYAKGGVQHSGLISPTFDFSGYSLITLSFRHYFRQYLESSSGILSYSVDQGNHWVPVKQWTADTPNPEDFSVNLPQLAGLPAVIFRWEYLGANSHYWLLDDVQVTGGTGIFAELTVDSPDVFTGHPVVFNDASGGGEIYGRTWDFGQDAVASGTTGVGPHQVVYQKPGLKTITLTINDTITVVKEDYIMVHPVHFDTPSLLKAQVAYQDVDLQWTQPGASFWMKWDSGVNANGLGTGEAATFQVAQRYTPEALLRKGAGSRYLTQVAWMPREKDAIYTIKIWVGGNWDERNPGKLVAARLIDEVVEGQWNVVQLNHPVFVDPTQELWIGYHVNTLEGHPVGMDQGKALEDLGNLIFWEGAWTTLADFNIDRNVNIHGFFEAAPPVQEPVADQVVDHVEEEYDAPAKDQVPESVNSLVDTSIAYHLESGSLVPRLSGYDLYRNDELHATFDKPHDVRFIDPDLEDGTYQYHVVARYSDPAGESALSNIIEVMIDGTEPQYTFILENDPVQGGEVEDLTAKAEYQPGDQILVKATAYEGFAFKEWITSQGAVSDLPEFTFEMPASHVVLTALFQSTVGISQLSDNGLQVYPNPSRGVFAIHSESLIQNIMVHDIAGKIMLNKNIDNNHFILSCSDWKPGIYFMQVVTPDGVSVRKLILMDH